MALETFLGLCIATALPWLSGYILIRGLLIRPLSVHAHRATRMGLGFFVGQLLVFTGLYLSDALFGSWSLWPAVALFVFAGILGWILANRSVEAALFHQNVFEKRVTHTTSETQSSSLTPILTWLLIALCAVHLLYVTVEVLHRPVFPWDGWLNWMYRAKAWFYADQLLSFDTPAQWLAGERTEHYAVAGRHYPALVPLTAVWMAMLTGGWSETLVNFPTLLAGFALTLCMFGLAKEARLPNWAGALAAYLFISLPLVDTHLSLAGMADVWMAGFAGIGFACLFLGLYRGISGWIVLGLCLVLLSRLVKVEGSVWLIAALLSTAIALRPRLALGTLLGGALAVLCALIMGIQSVEVPLLGPLGIQNERLYVPLIGNYALANWQLLDDYKDNFLRGGSWHLLWPLLGMGLVLLLRFREFQLARIASICLSSIVLATFFIFQFTQNGAWAEDWSAINRLPLHLTPLLSLVLVLLTVQLVRLPRRVGLAMPILLGTVAAIVSISVFAWTANSESRKETGEPVEFLGKDFKAMLGGVEAQADGSVVYTQFQDGIAVLSSGEIKYSANETSLITIDTSGDNRQPMTLFWRTSSTPTELQTAFVDDRGTVTLNLAEQPHWTATILELGITAFDDGGSLSLRRLALQPNNAAAQRSKALVDWFTPNTWSQRSVNWVDAGSPETRIALPVVLSAGLLAALIIALVLPVSRFAGSAAVAWVFVTAVMWLTLDARWMRSQSLMAEQTLKDFDFLSSTALTLGGDRQVNRLVERYRPEFQSAPAQRLPGEPPLIIVASENPAQQFERLRARYHLLPLAGLEVTTVSSRGSTNADGVMLIKASFREPGQPDLLSTQWLKTLGASEWVVAEENTDGALLRRR